MLPFLLFDPTDLRQIEELRLNETARCSGPALIFSTPPQQIMPTCQFSCELPEYAVDGGLDSADFVTSSSLWADPAGLRGQLRSFDFAFRLRVESTRRRDRVRLNFLAPTEQDAFRTAQPARKTSLFRCYACPECFGWRTAGRKFASHARDRLKGIWVAPLRPFGYEARFEGHQG